MGSGEKPDTIVFFTETDTIVFSSEIVTTVSL